MKRRFKATGQEPALFLCEKYVWQIGNEAPAILEDGGIFSIIINHA